MGEDLALPERNAVRTPMQWTDTATAGFSTATPEDLAAPVIAEGPYRYQDVNVLAQRRAPDSLLTWFERMSRRSPRNATSRCRSPADGVYPAEVDLLALDVHGNGYRWLRLNHTPWD